MGRVGIDNARNNSEYKFRHSDIVGVYFPQIKQLHVKKLIFNK